MGPPSTSAALPARRAPLPWYRFVVFGLLLLWVVALGLAIWRESDTWLHRVFAAPIVVCLALLPLLLLFEISGLIRMFGPVFYYDLVRQSRRLRYVIIRFLYAAGLFGLIGWVYWQWSLDYRYREIPVRDLPQFAQSFFFAFLGAQTLLVLVLTPAYTAGAITDEKERKTLQFLLATDLYDREIIFSKLLSRIFNILLAVLVGLPILSILQFIGGIDPNLLLASFCATAAVVVSLASLSIFNSTLLKRSRDSILLTYLTPPIYVLLSSVARVALPFLVAQYDSNLLLWPGTPEEPAFLSVMDVLTGFSAGDPIYIIQAFDDMSTPGSTITLWELTRDFVLFQGYVAIVCVGGSLALLRRQALTEASETQRKGWTLPRPAVGNAAMIWKEVWAERGLQLHLLARAGLIGLILLSFVPAYFIIEHYVNPPTYYRSYYSRERELRSAMNGNVRIVGSGVASLLLLGVAVRAASSVSGERDRQTFDTLLTTPLESGEIVLGKAIGSVASMRWLMLWLTAHWFLAVVTGGLSPLALPLVAGLWLVYATFAALVGLWYSIVCKTTLGATVATLSTLVGLAFGHWLIWMCCLPVMFRGGGGGGSDGMEVIAKFQCGLTPPISMGMCAFNMDSVDKEDQFEMLAYSFAGTTVWVLCIVGLWAMVNERFALISRRSPGSLNPDKRRGARPRRPRPREPESGDEAPPRSTSIYRPDDQVRPKEDDDE